MKTLSVKSARSVEIKLNNYCDKKEDGVTCTVFAKSYTVGREDKRMDNKTMLIESIDTYLNPHDLMMVLYQRMA